MRSETVADRELVDLLPAAARWGCDAATTASDGRTDAVHAPATAAVTPAVKTSFQQQHKQTGARVSRPHAASPKVAVVLAAKGRIAAAT